MRSLVGSRVGHGGHYIGAGNDPEGVTVVVYHDDSMDVRVDHLPGNCAEQRLRRTRHQVGASETRCLSTNTIVVHDCQAADLVAHQSHPENQSG